MLGYNCYILLLFKFFKHLLLSIYFKHDTFRVLDIPSMVIWGNDDAVAPEKFFKGPLKIKNLLYESF